MGNRKNKDTFLTVIKVESGIPASVEIFEDVFKAERREKYIRRYMHPENDETGLFEVSINSGKSSS